MDKFFRKGVYEFDDFRLDAGSLILSRAGEEIAIAPKAVEILLALIGRAGEVVSKNELLDIVWPDTVVEESNLFAYLSHLRKALGDRDDGRSYVETLRRRGYRFVGDVRMSTATGLDDPKHTQTPSTDGPTQRAGAIELPTKGGKKATSGEWLREKHDSERTVVKADAVDNIDAVSSPGTRWWHLAAAVLLGMLVLGSLGLYIGKSNSQPAGPGIKTIAVLPFKPLVSGSRNEYFEFGMADSLIGRLNSSGEIIARPLSSVRRLAGEDRDAVTVGRELATDYVLEGNIQTIDDRVKVSVSLVRTEDGREVWRRAFIEKFSGIFEVQDAIAEKVGNELRPQLTDIKKTLLAKRGTENTEAYKFYIYGRYHSARLVLPETQKAISYLKQAIELDPNYALAYAELSNTYRAQALGGDLPAKEVLPRAKDAALRALEIDDNLADAHVMMGYVAMLYDRNWEEAEKQAKRALELEPNSTTATYLLENLYSYLGRHDEAIEMGKRSCELAPLTPIYNSVEAQTALYAGRVDAALERAIKAREQDENFWHVHLTLARIYAEKGMYPDAIAEAERAAQLSGDHSYDLAVKGYALARSGAALEAERIIGELLKRSGNARHHTNIALVYVGLGDKAKALEHLEKGFDAMELQMELKVAPAWNSLRSEPRFKELLRRMGLEG